MEILKYLHTKNECYKVGKKMIPKGIMVHSTGANNTNLCRYVGSDDILGINKYNNHWNQFRPDGRQVCVHAFIGKLKSGKIATCQTLPFDMQGWHAGGKANQTYIGFEICEDNLQDSVYFDNVMDEATRFCAYLCKTYGLSINNIISHAEGHKKGIASNHGDIDHWLRKFNQNMNNFRAQVSYYLLDESEETETLYRVRIDWNKPSTQVGAYKSLEGARNVRDRMNENIHFYKIYDEKGNEVK